MEKLIKKPKKKNKKASMFMVSYDTETMKFESDPFTTLKDAKDYIEKDIEDYPEDFEGITVYIYTLTPTLSVLTETKTKTTYTKI